VTDGSGDLRVQQFRRLPHHRELRPTVAVEHGSRAFPYRRVVADAVVAAQPAKIIEDAADRGPVRHHRGAILPEGEAATHFGHAENAMAFKRTARGLGTNYGAAQQQIRADS